MATMVSVAVVPTTGMPMAAMVFDEQNTRIVTDEGDLPGSREALDRMNALYREAGKDLHPLEAFDLYCSAHGWKSGPPIKVNASDFPSAVELTRANLAASYGSASLARQARLRQVAQAWDRRLKVDADVFTDDDDAVAGMHPDWASRFAREAGIKPKRLTSKEKAAALAFLDEWLDAHPDPADLEVVD